MASREEKYLGLQVLRAVAALAVVAGHSTDYLLVQTGRVPRQLSWVHGPAGVDIFFVISGFVMMITSRPLLERANPARLFLWRRFLRIIPLYWLLTLVRLALVHWRPGLSQHGVPSLWNSVSSFLFIPSTAPGGEIRPIIPVGWTLSFEMLFYYVFAVGLAWRGKLLRIVTAAILVVAMLGVLRTAMWPVWTALADPIVLEFLGGVWIGELFLRGRRLSPRIGAVVLCLGVAGFLTMVPGPNVLSRPLTWGVFALLAVSGMLAIEHSIAPRLPQWALLLGDASYSIYLVQMFVFPPLHFALAHWSPTLVLLHPLAVGVWMMGISLVLSSLLGVAVHLAVERPVTYRLRRLFDVSRPLAVTP